MSKLEEFIEDCINLLIEHNEILESKKSIICKTFENIFKDDNITVIGRVKTEKSLREKIIRNNYYNKFEGNPQKLFEGLSDMIGIRINCLLTREEEGHFSKILKNCDNVKNSKYSHCIKGETDICGKFFIDLTSQQPEQQKNGKDIYRIDSIYKDDDICFRVEIQIKSSINALWGEIEHKLFYKNYEYLLSQEFYSNMMSLIYENLDSVEKQLELLKDHIECEVDDIDEAREFLSKLLYRRYKEQCLLLAYNCKIDFRSTCKLVSELYFTTPNNSFRELKDGVEIIREQGEFIFIESENTVLNKRVFEQRCPDNVKKIASNIDEIINKKENIYWKAFLNIYSIINRKNDYTETIIFLADKLQVRVNNIVELAINVSSDDLLDDAYIEIFSIVIESIADFLLETPKFEVFFNDNLNKFKSIIINLFSSNNNLIEVNLAENIRSEVKEYLDIMLKIIILNEVDFDKFNLLNNNSELTLLNKENEDEFKKIMDIYELGEETLNIKRIKEILIQEGVDKND